jgi:hypothetical protein
MGCWHGWHGGHGCGPGFGPTDVRDWYYRERERSVGPEDLEDKLSSLRREVQRLEADLADLRRREGTAAENR